MGRSHCLYLNDVQLDSAPIWLYSHNTNGVLMTPPFHGSRSTLYLSTLLSAQEVDLNELHCMGCLLAFCFLLGLGPEEPLQSLGRGRMGISNNYYPGLLLVRSPQAGYVIQWRITAPLKVANYRILSFWGAAPAPPLCPFGFGRNSRCY